MLNNLLNNSILFFDYIFLFLKSISPEIIAGVFIFIISERHRIKQKNRARFKEARIRFLVYIESFLDVIVSEKIDEDNKERLATISRTLREKYSEIESLVLILNKSEKEKWRKNFKIIRDDIKIFALINSIGRFNIHGYVVDRMDQIIKLKEILGSD